MHGSFLAFIASYYKEALCLANATSLPKGQWPMVYRFFTEFFFGFSVFIYVCRLCINFQDLCASLLGDITPLFMFCD